MKQIISLVVLILLIPLFGFSQDFLEDLKGNATPITGSDTTTYVSIKANVGDNSIKANLFKLFTPSKWDNPDNKHSIGLGFSVKGEAEEGVSSLFSKAKFSPGFSGGMYLAGMILNKSEGAITFIILSGNVTANHYQIFDTTLPKSKTYDTTFVGFNTAISAFHVFNLHHKKDNLILGGAIEFSKKNNYSDLDKVEIKNYTSSFDSTTNTTQIIYDIDDDGYNYGKGVFKSTLNLRLRCNLSYIPGALNNRLAFIFYPSLDFKNLNNDNKRTAFNLGVGIHFLEKGNPMNSVAGIYFEFNDINNSKKITDQTFFKRSFQVGLIAGISTALFKK